ncbi:hypothetical protein X943_001390 [Babesia divergens]|uniref:Transmembrane protein n=1 Tax=Babesia divergens TaxID=32595 RepID=A0AAD9GJG8_BABDI|nr:hypothetical protein X943_001390 [Babesia divergens]
MSIILGRVILWATLFTGMSCAAHSVDRQAFLAPSTVPVTCHRIFSPTSSVTFGASRVLPLSPSNGTSHQVLTLYAKKGKTDKPREPFAGSDDIMNKGYISCSSLFSDNTLELTMEDMAAREVDFEHYKSRSVSHLRKVGIVAASVVTVGLLYTAMNALKAMMNQQHEKLSSNRYDGASAPSDGGFHSDGE